MSHLTVSDWIEFLSSEKHSTADRIQSFGALLIAGLALLLTLQASFDKWYIALAILVALVFGMYYIPGAFDRSERHVKEASTLLNEIMSDGLEDTGQIRKRWNELTKRGQQEKTKKHAPAI